MGSSPDSPKHALITPVRRFFSTRGRPGNAGHPAADTAAPLCVVEATTLDQVLAFFASRPEAAGLPASRPRFLAGRCYVCDRDTRFRIDGHEQTVNWRETLSCERCGLVNRWRGAYHVFEMLGQPWREADIFATEAVSPLFRRLRSRYPRAVGSEYRPGARPGSRIRVRLRRAQMQDVTALTFSNASFDYLLSLDVLEHVPAYEPALSEFHRVLRPGGLLLLSVPFAARDAHETRASMGAEGQIMHHLAPVYHHDPTDRNGALCFRSFGMRLLGELRHAGFEHCRAVCYAAPEWGYLGGDVMFVARRG